MRGQYEDLKRIREELREQIRQARANAAQFTRITKASADGTKDSVHGHRTQGSGEQDYDFFVRRMQHFGFRSVPLAGVWAIRLPAGRGANGVTVAEDSTRYGPTNLNPGEVALYNKVNGCTIVLDQNGNIIVTPGAGGTVQLAGTSYHIPLWDKFQGDFKKLLQVVQAIITSNCVNGSPLAGNAVSPAGDGAAATNVVELGNLITSLSNFANYQSTLVQNS